MKEFELIKKFYKPIQPSIKAEQKNIIYQELRPNVQLENFIYCYWQLKTTKQLERPFVYRVVADGCVDIFFNHKDPAECFVMGFCRKYTEFPLDITFDYIGIRFFPSAFSQLFKVDAKVLSNQSQELIGILPGIVKDIWRDISEDQDFTTVSEKLNTIMVSELNQNSFDFDTRLYRALNLIFTKSGRLETERSLDIGLSPRQLRRIFNYYIGTTPKAFSKVVRFQHVLNAKPFIQGLKENSLFLDAGFYDQAHFIKEFKTFYGITPSQAL